MLNHLQACEHCDRHEDSGCTVYTDTSWVNRQGGCPMFPSRELPKGWSYQGNKVISPENKRVGQQRGKRGKKQKEVHYHNKNKNKRSR